MSILGAIGGAARAAAPGALAARVGYLRGEDEREQREIAAAKQARAEKRQSILDDIKAKRDAAEIRKLDKETSEMGADHGTLLNDEDVGDGPVVYKKDGSTTPLLDGVGQPIKYHPKPKAPVRGTPEYEAALRREARIRSEYRTSGSGTDPKDKELNDQIRNVNSQIGATDRATTANANDLDSSAEAVKARGDSLRARRDSLVGVSDSLNGVQRDRAAAKSGGTVTPKLTPAHESAPAGGMASIRSGATRPAAAPASSKRQISQDQYDFLTAPASQGGKGMSKASVDSLYAVKKP